MPADSLDLQLEPPPDWVRCEIVAGHPVAVDLDLQLLASNDLPILDIGCASLNFYNGIKEYADDSEVVGFDPMVDAEAVPWKNVRQVAVVGPVEGTRVVYVPLAVSSHWDSHAVDVGGRGSRIRDPQKVIRVPAIGVNNLLKERVRLLKLDCEGSEFEILKWMFSQPEPLADQITAEMHPYLLADDEREPVIRELVDLSRKHYYSALVPVNSDQHLLFIARDTV